LAKAHGAAGAALATLFANSIAGFMNVWFATRLPQAANAAIGDFYLFKARDWHDLKSLIRVYPRRTHE
jgi:Na+-driven multidrug efflux pump